MIKFVHTEDVLALRNKVLREGKLKDSECVFDNDNATDTFHLAYETDGKLVCVASFHKILNEKFTGEAYQLRGMATLEEYRGRGYGNMLLNFAIVYLRGKKINYLWCNARKVAYRFYLALGFEFVSDEFEITGIGPHKVMYLKIQ